MVRRPGKASTTRTVFRGTVLTLVCLCSLVTHVFLANIDPQNSWFGLWSQVEHKDGHDQHGDDHEHEDDFVLVEPSDTARSGTLSLAGAAVRLPASLSVSPLLPPPKTA